MASPKLKLCLVLTLVVMAVHRVESQCQEFITPPVDTVAVVNTMACLTCDYPDRTNEEWFRDGSIIQVDTTLCDCEVFPDQGRICFNSVTSADTGTYSCEVQIGPGQVCDVSADLLLAVAPVIDKDNTAAVTVIEEDTATIPVTVDEGRPDPTVEFRKDGQALSSASDPRVSVTNTGNDWELTIADVSRDDRGDYTIVATNAAGEDTFSRRLLVQFLPAITVEQSAPVNNMVTLTCSAIAYPRPFENAVLWERTSDGMRLDSEEMFTETDIDFTVTTTTEVDVSVCEPEGYRCVVQNSRGLTRQSITLCSDPPSPPVITVTSVSRTSVRVTWIRVTNPIANNYTIEYRQVDDNGAYMSRTVQEEGQQAFDITIGGLMRGAEYEFRAVSANSAGRGAFGTTMTVKLPSGDPVTGVLVVSTAVDDERAISISWNPYPEAVTEYLIHYSISNVDETPIRVASDESSFLLRPVDCSSNNMITFKFQIQANTLLGEEPMSREVQLDIDCTTPPEPAQMVTIQTVVLSGTAITVTWQRTADTNVEGLVIRLSEFDPSGVIKATMNYTVPRDEFDQLYKCVGELTLKTAYEVCIVANITGRVSEELDCYDSVVRTLEEDTADLSGCAEPTSVELGDPAEASNGGIADWVIAVIVVGALAVVALVFCLMGVFFACHTSQKKGEVGFGSQSSVHTESLSSNMHIHDHRSMSSTSSCFAHHLKGHSTDWGEHADTLKALESGVPTVV